MALNWTLIGESEYTGKSSIYIDFTFGPVCTPDTINSTNGGVVMTRGMTGNTYGDFNPIVSASANDYVNLNGYNGDTLYCNLYQISDSGTTSQLNNYYMSLTLSEIGSGTTGPLGITGTQYSP